MTPLFYASWTWAMATPTASAAECPVRHPYCPGRKPWVASQCSLIRSAATFSTTLPMQSSREMHQYALAAL